MLSSHYIILYYIILYVVSMWPFCRLMSCCFVASLTWICITWCVFTWVRWMPLIGWGHYTELKPRPFLFSSWGAFLKKFPFLFLAIFFNVSWIASTLFRQVFSYLKASEGLFYLFCDFILKSSNSRLTSALPQCIMGQQPITLTHMKSRY